jgi:hypothetical protein
MSQNVPLIEKRKPCDLNKRAANLQFSQAYKTALAYFNPKSPLAGKYQSSTFCSTVLKKESGSITTRYCGNRWCNVCNRIRTGKLMNDHGDIIESLAVPFFVTLTIPNVPGDQLKNASVCMLKTFGRIIKNIQQDRKRKNDRNVMGFRKIECTFNQEYKDFHPHLHVIVDDEAAALQIREEWLKKYYYAAHYLQDVRPCSSKAAKELFKYVTKMLPKKKDGHSWDCFFSDEEKTADFFKGMDKIYVAYQGIRTIQSFGYKHTPDEVINNDIEATEIEEVMPDEEELKVKVSSYEGTDQAEDGKFLWNQSAKTWINPDTGEFLIDPGEQKPKLRRLVELIYKSCGKYHK